MSESVSPIITSAATKAWPAAAASTSENTFFGVESQPAAEMRERILIVDDSTTIRKVFASGLSHRYDCAEAASVSEALERLKTDEFALVLADIIMPGLSGIELLRKIIESYPETAVIMISGVDRPQRALDALRLGAFDYLIKPCDLFVLELTVQRAIERRSLLKDAKRYRADLEARNAELVNGKAQLERLQAQIIHSEKMASLGQLAAGVAHELNNPVGFIHANLDLLKDCIEGLIGLLEFYELVNTDPEIISKAQRLKQEIDFELSAEDLGSIIQDCTEGAERIREIVQNLRTFSRLDEAEFKKTDVHEGLDSTTRLLSRYFSLENIVLVRNYGELPLIDGYSGQLNQVWMNLLANAAQAIIETGGEVKISTRTEGQTVVVDISDTGGGIPAEHLDRIFDPFFTTKPVGEGTGLGLSISFGIVKRHNGTITLNTQREVGTTFTVTLPAHLTKLSTESPEDEESE